MAQPELIAYIKENTGKFEKTAIVQALVATGWSLADINAAFLELAPPSEKAPAPAPASPAVMPPASAIAPDKILSQTPVQTSQNAAFLAEMERHRKEAAALNPNKIVDGDVEVSIGAAAAQTAAPQEGITGMLIKTGLVKNEQQANMFMIAAAVVMLGVSAWFIL